MKLLLRTTCALLLATSVAKGQIIASYFTNPQQLQAALNAFTGGGITITNVSYTGNGQQVGAFSFPNSNIWYQYRIFAYYRTGRWCRTEVLPGI